MSAEQIAEVIRAHQPTTGMSVASGVTCRCGYWNGNERAGVDRPPGYQGLQWHQAQELAAAGFGLVAEARAPEVRYATLTNGEAELDEVVATNASVHLEAMDDNHWWLLVESGGKSVHVNFYTKRAKISGHAEIDDVEEPARAVAERGGEP